jgi:hypothetical protein
LNQTPNHAKQYVKTPNKKFRDIIAVPLHERRNAIRVIIANLPTFDNQRKIIKRKVKTKMKTKAKKKIIIK